MKYAHLLFGFFLGCESYHAPDESIVSTAYYNGATDTLHVVKYIDKDRDGDVDLYGYGSGFGAGSHDSYGLYSDANFFHSREYAERIGFKQRKAYGKEKINPSVMPPSMEDRVNGEYQHLKRRVTLDGVASVP